MSNKNNKDYLDYDMIYKQNDDIENKSNEKYKEKIIFEIIYKINEDKKDKLIKMKEFNPCHFYLVDKKEYKKHTLRLFGKNFIINNRNKCKINYKNKKYRLKEYFEELEEKYYFFQNYSGLIKLGIIFMENYIDMSYMFFGCYHLNSFSEYQIQNREMLYYKKNINVFNLSYMFTGCISLKSISDISNWDTSNVKNMKYMFYQCESLISLPDISKWNTSNVIDMKLMFYRCKLSENLINFYLSNLCETNNIFELTYQNKDANKNKMRIFGNKFINKNRDKGAIIYNNKEYELKEYIEVIKNNDENLIKIILYLDKNIYDMSYIFYECESLLSIDRYNQSYENKQEINYLFNINDNIDIYNILISNNDSMIRLSQISSITNKIKKIFLQDMKAFVIVQ